MAKPSSGEPGRPSARARVQAQREAERRARLRRRVLLVLAGVVVIVAIIIGLAVSLPTGRSTSSAHLGPEGMPLQTGPDLASASTAASGQSVDGISCSATEQVAYHIHAHLAVYVDGRPRTIPYGIGTVKPIASNTPSGVFAQASTCYYWLHTHVSDGVIHVESPNQAQYTLGQFFDIWQQPLSAAQVGPATGAVTAYVNGKPFTGNPRDIPLQPHEAIQLDVGTPHITPQPVDWSHSQL